MKTCKKIDKTIENKKPLLLIIPHENLHLPTIQQLYLQPQTLQPTLPQHQSLEPIFTFPKK